MQTNNKTYTLYGFKDFGNKKRSFLCSFMNNRFITNTSFNYFFTINHRAMYTNKKYNDETRRKFFNIFMNHFENDQKNEKIDYVLKNIKNITSNNNELNIIFFLKIICYLYIFRKAVPDMFYDEFRNTKAIKTTISINKEKNNNILLYKEIDIKTVLDRFEKLIEETKLDPVFFYTYKYVIGFNTINNLFYDVLISKLNGYKVYKIMNLEDLEEKLNKKLVFNPEVEKAIKIVKKTKYNYESETILNASNLFSKDNHDFVFSNICYIPVCVHKKLGNKIENYDDLMILCNMKNTLFHNHDNDDDDIKQIFSNEKNKKMIKILSATYYNSFLFLFKNNSMENFYDFLVSVSGIGTGIMEKNNQSTFLARSTIDPVKKIVNFYTSL